MADIKLLDSILDSISKNVNVKDVNITKLQKDKTRCFGCSKKVGLVGIECRCGYIYCSICRVPDKHTCSFDYITHDRSILEKALVKAENQIEQL